MMKSYVLIAVVCIIVFIVDLTLSQDPTLDGNPGTLSTGLDTSNALNSVDTVQTGEQVGNAIDKARPQSGKPRRRKTRRRRLRNRRKNRNKKTQTTNIPENTTKKLTDIQDPNVQTLISENNAPVDVNQNNGIGAAAATRQGAAAKTAVNSRRTAAKKQVVEQLDSFFDFFETTTVVNSDSNAAPPDFDPNRTPGEKVMPTVDPSKAKAHDGRPCNETYKPHDTTPTKYMMKYAEGVWETLDCPPNLGSGLVWRQDLCSCGEELVPQDPNDWCGLLGYNAHVENKHKYLRRHHGADAVMECAASLVWSQEKCLCIYDPTVIDRPIEDKVTFVCKTILELRFEGNLTNSADGYHVQTVRLNRRGLLPRIRFMKTRGASGKAAMIVSQPLEFQAFRGNDFQTQVTYSINFKISPRHRNRKMFMTLLTDECLGNFGGQNKERKPSFSLTFQPFTRSFRLQFRTDMAEVDKIIKNAQPDNDGWYKTVVYLEDAVVNLENNGQKLLSEPDIFGKIPQNKCPLYIAGRGQGFDRSRDFYGYMDNVFLVKDCKFNEANIKFL